MAAIERRDIPGFESAYQVSADGRVYSLKRDAAGLEMKPGKNPGGYLHLRLMAGPGRRVNVDIHVAVACAFIGARPAGMQVNHKDGVKTNNTASNLEYCTRSDNQKHAHAIGLATKKGERNPRCKLKAEAVREIIRLIARNTDRREIARSFGVTPTRISQIKHGARAAEVGQ